MQKSKLQFKMQKYPNFDEEKKRWKQGYRMVVGLDEAGRGPLAGPVVAAAVCISCDYVIATQHLSRKVLGRNDTPLRDSKKLTPKQREEWFKILTRHPNIKWGIGAVSEKIIDKINIFEATKLAMKKAISNLAMSYRVSSGRNIHDRANRSIGFDLLILDGNFTLEDLPISQKAIIRGDEKVFSCAAASIIAKVTRDRIMCRYAKKYLEYGFERHKGYGTRAHCKMLRKHGPCAIHRKSFKPIKSL